MRGQNSRHMAETGVEGRKPQGEIVQISGAAVGAKTIGSEESVAPDHEQLAHIHAARQEIGRPIWLEKGTEPPSGRVHAIFVRVDDINLSMLASGGNTMQGEPRERIALSRKTKEIAAREFGGSILKRRRAPRPGLDTRDPVTEMRKIAQAALGLGIQRET